MKEYGAYCRNNQHLAQAESGAQRLVSLYGATHPSQMAAESGQQAASSTTCGNFVLPRRAIDASRNNAYFHFGERSI
jgi:hypothetical protein